MVNGAAPTICSFKFGKPLKATNIDSLGKTSFNELSLNIFTCLATLGVLGQVDYIE